MSLYRTQIDRSPTHIYYNVAITNNSNVSIPATFAETRTDNILENPSDYRVAVATFTVPTYIPIFQFQPNVYSVTLLYQDTPVQVYVSNIISSSPAVPLLTAVNNYQEFLDAINLAFKSAYNTLAPLIVGGPPAPCPPFIVFDPNTQLFSMVAHIGYNTYGSNTSLNDTIMIYMNSSLISFFPGWYTQKYGEGLANGLDTQIIVTANSNYLSWGVFSGSYYPPATYTTVTGTTSSAGTIEQSGNIVTGSGTSFNVGMIGGTYTPNGYENGLVTAYSSPTSITVSISQTISSPTTYTIESPAPESSPPGTLTTYLYGPYLPPQQPINVPYYDDIYASYQPYFVNTQMFPQTSAWYSAKTLQICTNLLPVTLELLPSGSIQNAGSNNNNRAILTNFEFDLTQNVAQVIGYTQYTPSLYRLIDMNQTTPLKSIDIQVYYTDNLANVTPLMIPPLNQLLLKLVFVKKNPVQNAS